MSLLQTMKKKSSSDILEDEVQLSFFSIFNSKIIKLTFKEYLQKENIKIPIFLEKPIFITEKESIEDLEFYLHHFPKFIRMDYVQKIIKEYKEIERESFEEIEMLKTTFDDEDFKKRFVQDKFIELFFYLSKDN